MIWAKNTSQSSFPTLQCIWRLRSLRSPRGYLFDYLCFHFFPCIAWLEVILVKKIRSPGHEAKLLHSLPLYSVLLAIQKELFGSVLVEICRSNDWKHLSNSIICCVHYFLVWLKIFLVWLKFHAGIDNKYRNPNFIFRGCKETQVLCF